MKARGIRNIAGEGVAILVIVMGFCFPLFGAEAFSYSQSFDFPIPAGNSPDGQAGKGWMTEAIIDIDDHFAIGDLDVVLNLTHDDFFDLQISIKNPTGTEIVLATYGNPVWFNTGGHRNFVFDDEAELSPIDVNAPFASRLRPIGPFTLSAFDSHDVFGPWTIKIYDGFYGDFGTLHSVELRFINPEPASILLFASGTFLLALRRQR